MKAALKSGADPNAPSNTPRPITPLFCVAQNGDIAAMERAIKEGARINGTGPDGKSALGAAVRLTIYKDSLAAAIGWLLDRGADPNQEIVDSGLPPHLFIESNIYTLAERSSRADAKAMAEETLARLLKAGAKVSGRDRQGRTPLHVAAETDNVLVATVLIMKGANVMARDETGKTPLDYAESAPMIELLKANGATER